MNSSFEFDFDDAENSIKKIKEKEAKELQEKLEKANIWNSTIPWLVNSKITISAEWSNFTDILKPIEFGKIQYPQTTKIRQSCDCCKNNAQKYINTCRKCKVFDRRNKQSNFVIDESIELGPPIPKMNHIWQQTFDE